MSKSTAFQIEFAGRTVYCSVSLCCFMYPRYGFQMGMSLDSNAPNLGIVFVKDASFKVMDVPLTKVMAKAKQMATEWVQSLDNRQQLVDAEKTLNDFRTRCAADEAKADKREKARLDKAKADGFTHLLRVVVHPRNGSDYMKSVLTVGKPADSLIKRLMARSVVKDSYKVFAL